MGRTMAEIAARYDERRDSILQNIRDGKCSASMSGIEHFPKPWSELDVSIEGDLSTISAALAWNGECHDLEGLRRFSAEELQLRRKIRETYSEPMGPKREIKIKLLQEQLERVRP